MEQVLWIDDLELQWCPLFLDPLRPQRKVNTPSACIREYVQVCKISKHACSYKPTMYQPLPADRLTDRNQEILGLLCNGRKPFENDASVFWADPKWSRTVIFFQWQCSVILIAKDMWYKVCLLSVVYIFMLTRMQHWNVQVGIFGDLKSVNKCTLYKIWLVTKCTIKFQFQVFIQLHIAILILWRAL